MSYRIRSYPTGIRCDMTFEIANATDRGEITPLETQEFLLETDILPLLRPML